MISEQLQLEQLAVGAEMKPAQKPFLEFYCPTKSMLDKEQVQQLYAWIGNWLKRLNKEEPK